MSEVTTQSNVEVVDTGVYKEGQEFVVDLKRAVPEGTKRGIKLVNEVTQNPLKRFFDESLIQDLNRRIVYYLPAIAGEYRSEGEDGWIAGLNPDGTVDKHRYRLTSGRDLALRMYAFGLWLREQTEELKQEENHNDLIKALKLASEVCYGLACPSYHPFREGNGRTARLLANGILMIHASEMRFYGIPIVPVPLIRQVPAGQVPKENTQDPYIRSLVKVNETHDLNHLTLFIAILWRNNLLSMMVDYQEAIKNGKIARLKRGDKYLLDRFNFRIDKLHEFILGQNPATHKVEPHPIPDYRPTSFIRFF